MEFQGFDSYEEMMDAIDKAREAADTRVAPWQADVKAGDYFVQATEYGFLIFGHVQESDEEFYKTDKGKHFRFCRCFSVACPEGELGDVHVSVITLVISESVFRRYEAKHWAVEDGDTFT